MLSRIERAVYLATALVVMAAILWPLVGNELDRAPRPAPCRTWNSRALWRFLGACHTEAIHPETA